MKTLCKITPIEGTAVTRLVQVIFTEERRGYGTDENPFRLVPQLWTLDGKLICESENTHTNIMLGRGFFNSFAHHNILLGLRNG